MKTTLSNAGAELVSGAGVNPAMKGFKGRNPYRKVVMPASVSNTSAESDMGPARALVAIVRGECGAVPVGREGLRSRRARARAARGPRLAPAFGFLGPRAGRGKTLLGGPTALAPHLNSFSESRHPFNLSPAKALVVNMVNFTVGTLTTPAPAPSQPGPRGGPWFC